MSKKISAGVLGFVSVIFLNILKTYKQKNCVRFFRICKYAFLIFEKGVSEKIAPGFLGFLSVPF